LGDLVSSKILDRFKAIISSRSISVGSINVSMGIVTVLLVAVSIFLLAGGVYDIIQARLGSLVVLLPSPQYPQFYYTGMSDQTFNESVYFIVFLVMGISGGYVSYGSSRHAYRPREAKMLLIVGAALLIIGTIGCEAMLRWKGL